MERIIPWTPEHKMFRESIKKFVEKEMVPYYQQWEDDGIVSREVYKKLGAIGGLCPWAEEKYGGAAGDFLYSVIVAEEIANHGCKSMEAWLHNDLVGPYIKNFATEEQKERWLPGCVTGDIILAVAMTEPDSGSDLASMRTRAVKDGDDYIINGSKTFISNGILGDLIVVATKTDPDKGARGITLFGVERGTPGFERGRNIDKVGMHAQDTAELFFEDCRVPAKNIIGGLNEGWSCLMSGLQQERLLVSIIALGCTERAMELTLDYVKERKQFKKPIGSFQNTQFTLAECAAEIAVARGYIDTLILAHAKGEKILDEISMAKFWVCEMENRVISKCLQFFGGYGYCKEYEISRLWADARIETIYAGTSEIMKLIIARGLGLA